MPHVYVGAQGLEQGLIEFFRPAVGLLVVRTRNFDVRLQQQKELLPKFGDETAVHVRENAKGYALVAENGAQEHLSQVSRGDALRARLQPDSLRETIRPNNDGVVTTAVGSEMTAGLVQDADLDTGTVARADTKPLLSCQAPRACSHLKVDPPTPRGQGI